MTDNVNGVPAPDVTPADFAALTVPEKPKNVPAPILVPEPLGDLDLAARFRVEWRTFRGFHPGKEHGGATIATSARLDDAVRVLKEQASLFPDYGFIVHDNFSNVDVYGANMPPHAERRWYKSDAEVAVYDDAQR